MADMVDNVLEFCVSLCKNAEKERFCLTLLLLLVGIFSALCLAPTCAADQYYQIANAIVTPEYGYEDFTYSADVALSPEVAAKKGDVAVTNFELTLVIYNDTKQEHTETITQRGKTSFVFGPYNFKNRFGIDEADRATFAFSLNVDGHKANTGILRGPIVHQPELTGINFEAAPYFFQGISASVGFKDQDNLDPKPTCLLKITGPLGSSENRTWESELGAVACRSSGKSIYTCILNEPLTQYRDGGNFSFMLVYNNLKMSPLSFGPYSVTLRPYTPTAENPKIDKNLDYTNFTIQATVKDASAKMEESNPQGRLIISHPQKVDAVYTSSNPEISGEKVIFRWTQENDPALFNRSDVVLSKTAPFTARLEYTNDKWDFSAKSANVTFNVVEEVPKLSNPSIPENVYVSSGEISTQDMAVTVAFSKGPGDLNVRLTGPSMDFNSTLEGTPLGGNKYQYKWQVQFDDRHVNSNYTLSLSFLHDQLEGGRYDDFPARNIHVSSVSVQFLDGSVDAPVGQWNDRYNYSVKLNTSVPLTVQLQVYDPCSNDWTNKQTKDAAVGTASVLNWMLRPFAYECQEMAGRAAKYRFKASFAGEDITSSRAYNGPIFMGAVPTLISLTPEGDPMVVYVSEEGASSSVSATVEYGAGQGEAILRLMRPDGSLKMEEQSPGFALGSDRYRYDWSLPFDEADAGKSFNLSIAYTHSTLSGEYSLAEKTVTVLPVTIEFGVGKVFPAKGRWNGTFNYSVPVSSSVDTTVKLEVYNPCTHNWVQRASGKVSAGETTFTRNATPFRSKCADSEGNEASYRFTAGFGDKTSESEVYYGPIISGGKPTLVSVDFEPVLHVSEDAPTYLSVRAIVDFPQGQDAMQLAIVGPNKSSATEETGVYRGETQYGTQYSYTWSEEFNKENVGNHTLSLHNVHPETSGGEVSFTGTIKVVSDNTSSGLEPKAIGDVNYLPVLFVTLEKNTGQAFSAEVFSPGGQGTLILSLTGEGKNEQKEMSATDLGANRYKYDYAEQFDATDAGNSYMFSLDYQLNGKRYALFDDHMMQVALEGTEPLPIWEPKLLLDYDATLYVPEGGKADQPIHATINYSESGGILKLKLDGPNKNFTKDLSDRNIGVDRYLYETDMPFDGNDIGNNFTISLAFNHTSMPGGNYRFADHYMRVLKKAPENQQPRSSGTVTGGQINRVFNDSTVMVIGNVTSAVGVAVGVIQAWDEKDPLHALTYSLQLKNWSSSQMPSVELWVRGYGSDKIWKNEGIPDGYDPSTGTLSWTLKPFWQTPFLGMAEYKFMIDGAETHPFDGPNIIAIISDIDESEVPGSRTLAKYEAWVDASANLTLCIVAGDTNIPDQIKSWTIKGQCQDYDNGSGKKKFDWQVPKGMPYYDFDIKNKDKESAK
ncbi:MAG: hypothetical protein NTU95_04895 [Methanothrix sp.]|nr:hypothetical protein [Methanothrix sp.]